MGIQASFRNTADNFAFFALIFDVSPLLMGQTPAKT
jgi:hypothetical protein